MKTKKEKSCTRKFEWDLSSNSIEDQKRRPPQVGVNTSRLQFKHLSSGSNVLLEKSKCTPWGTCTPITKPLSKSVISDPIEENFVTVWEKIFEEKPYR